MNDLFLKLRNEKDHSEDIEPKRGSSTYLKCSLCSYRVKRWFVPKRRKRIASGRAYLERHYRVKHQKEYNLISNTMTDIDQGEIENES